MSSKQPAGAKPDDDYTSSGNGGAGHSAGSDDTLAAMPDPSSSGLSADGADAAEAMPAPSLADLREASLGAMPEASRTPFHGSSPGDETIAGGKPLQSSHADLPEPPDAPRVRGYKILGQLGHGGMGVVWRALQLATKREVALKLLGAGLFGSAAARRRFEREVELHARLDHPHVARVFESGLDHGVYFYAMELVDGVPLDRYVQEQKLNRRQLLQLVRLVCEAVQHAHQRGVIHRDLKPSNILVTADGRPKVLDFGLAKLLTEDGDGAPAGEDSLLVTRAGDVAGTPAFMSPEQAAGRPVDTRMDVFSLGVILYRLLTGKPPHDLSGTGPDLLRRISETDVVRPRAADRSLDRELEAVLLKALATDPDRRYASAGELARDLANYLAGEPVTAKAPTTLYFLRKRIRKYRWPVSAAAAVLLLAAGLIGFAVARVADAKLLAEQNAVRFRDQKLLADAERAVAQEQTRLAEARLAQSLVATGDSHVAAQRHPEARAAYASALEVAQRVDSSEVRLAADAGTLQSLSASPPPLLGPDAAGLGPGGFHMGGAVGFTCVAVAPDGRRLATGTQTGFRTWDLTTGLELNRAEAGGGRTNALAWSPDGLTLASGGAGPHVQLWDAVTGAPGHTLWGHTGPVTALAFTSDGATLLTGGEDGTLRRWDVRTGRPGWSTRSHGSPVTCIVPRPDRPVVVSGTASGTVLTHSLAAGEEVARYSGTEFRTRALGLTPDGRAVLNRSAGGSVAVWSLDPPGTSRMLDSADRTRSCAVSGDGQLILLGGTDGYVRLLSSETGRELRRFARHDGAVTGVALTPDAGRAVSVGLDGTVRRSRRQTARTSRVKAASRRWSSRC